MHIAQRLRLPGGPQEYQASLEGAAVPRADLGQPTPQLQISRLAIDEQFIIMMVMATVTKMVMPTVTKGVTLA